LELLRCGGSCEALKPATLNIDMPEIYFFRIAILDAIYMNLWGGKPNKINNLHGLCFIGAQL